MLRYHRFGDIPYLARQIEAGKPVPPPTVAAYAARATGIVDAGICSGDFVKGALTLALTDLDNQNQDAGYERWAASLERAERVARYALGCRPVDGNIWLRLAMIRQAAAEQPEEMEMMLAFSKSYAPSEENVIGGRYQLYNRLTKVTLDRLAGPLLDDLQLICADSGLRRQLPSPSPVLKGEIARLVPQCRPIGSQAAVKSGR
ncbi:hypothetical protein ACFFP0_15515 [Rhizobium puerariae]|uniref:Uncharacterized protein n=1 Tax=Rhizobium puerariae TaxID=1585791 RepID=A0ABV6AI30_9HYPH